MSKKILIPVIIALVAAMLVGGVALAAGKSPEGKNPPGRGGQGGGVSLGQITALGANQFTVQLKGGEIVTLQVDENTQFLTPAEEPAAFSDLTVGGWVLGAAKKDGEAFLARRLVILPEACDPSQITSRISGLIVEADGNTATVHVPSGENIAVTLDSATVYLGAAVQSFADLQDGMGASFGVRELEDGSLLAVLAAARPSLIRHAGEVTDVGSDTFTIAARDGEEYTFNVDDNTKFFSRKGVNSLADLKAGMMAGVAAEQQADGSLLAVRVAAGEKADLKVGGKITAIAEDSFTLTAKDGQTYTFQVSEETHFRSPGGKVNGLTDLKVGQRVGVGAQDLGDGNYLALTVLAIKR